MNYVNRYTNTLLSTKEYLQGELTSEVKHELIDGYAYAMVGASGNHERVSMTFESIELTLPVEAVYHRIQNEDMLGFLAKKAEE